MDAIQPSNLSFNDRLWRWVHQRNLVGRVSGIPISVVESAASVRARANGQLHSAVQLVQLYDPRSWQRMQRFVRGILVFGSPSATGSALCNVGIIKLNEPYVLAPTTSAASLASVLIHETTHLWLSSLGFDYREERRGRIERICTRAELRFARRCPGGSLLVDELERCLKRPDSDWSDASLDETLRHDALAYLPNCLVSPLMWIRRRHRRVV